jgi:Fur family transcriptional regulator, ferric uptake regulator
VQPLRNGPPMQRDTRQRKAIRKAVVEAGHPLSPRELHEAASTYVEGLGIATVYRNLNTLVEEGWLVPVELPGEPPRYERAGKDHHHHFHCRKCDRVYEVEGCPGNLRSVTPDGFELERHEFVLYGVCLSCAA